ncbi:hypothetical protein [Brevibacillus humidisoli]|nr:hypothetical protein [Brevibacillus humidisoli]
MNTKTHSVLVHLAGFPISHDFQYNFIRQRALREFRVGSASLILI